MWDFTPTIPEGDLFIVGYSNPFGHWYNTACKIKTLIRQTQLEMDWTILTNVPGLSPLVIVGGIKHVDEEVDIEMYTTSTDSWKHIGSLSFARSYPVV